MNNAAKLRTKLRNGETVFGVFCKATTPEWIECIGRAGFDFCILDREHGPAGYADLIPLVQAAELTGMAAIVRVPGVSEETIGHPLDLGADGVQVPQVDSGEMARAAVDQAKFAPRGHRGVCRFVRAAGYSQTPRAEYFAEANESLVVLQVEDTRDEVFNAVVEAADVDVLFLGPYDISQRLGRPGEVDHPDVIAELTRLIARARTKGKTVGIFADTAEQARRWIAAGCRYIAYSVDVGIFSDACRALIAALRTEEKACAAC